MVKKAYFDVEWTGPSVEVDANGNVTSKGQSGRKLFSNASACICFVVPLHVKVPGYIHPDMNVY